MATRPILPDLRPRFAALAAGVFLGLLLIWPLVHRPWAHLFRGAARAVAAACGATGNVQILPETLEATEGDTRVVLLDPAGAQGVSFDVPSFNESYAPFAVLAALFVADSMGRPGRRSPRTAVALAGVIGYMVLSWIVIVLRTAARAGSSLFEPGSSMRLVVELGYRVAVNPPAFEYVVPAVIWFACAAIWPRPVELEQC